MGSASPQLMPIFIALLRRFVSALVVIAIYSKLYVAGVVPQLCMDFSMPPSHV